MAAFKKRGLKTKFPRPLKMILVKIQDYICQFFFKSHKFSPKHFFCTIQRYHFVTFRIFCESLSLLKNYKFLLHILLFLIFHFTIGLSNFYGNIFPFEILFSLIFFFRKVNFIFISFYLPGRFFKESIVMFQIRGRNNDDVAGGQRGRNRRKLGRR